MADRLKLLTALLVAGMTMTAVPGYGVASGDAPRVDAGQMPPVTEQIRIPGIGVVPWTRLFEEVSRPGESLEDFLARVGIRLREFSDATTFEACAAVATDGQRWGVVVGTNGGRISCAVLGKAVPTGMRAMYATIHSHGNGAGKLTEADLLLKGIPRDAKSRMRLGTVWGQSLDKFSQEDLKGPPGYLAMPDGGLLYHDGEGQVRKVK